MYATSCGFQECVVFFVVVVVFSFLFFFFFFFVCVVVFLLFTRYSDHSSNLYRISRNLSFGSMA